MEKNTSLEQHFMNVLAKAQARHKEPPTYNPETKYKDLVEAIIDFYKEAKLESIYYSIRRG